MTLGQIVTEVLSHQFASNQYTDYLTGSSDFGDGIINEGQGYIAAQTDFREFFTTATTALPAGTEDLALPSDFSRLYSAVALQSGTEGNQPLAQITPSDFDRLPTDSAGKPQWYDIVGSTISVYPTPDASYTIQLRYWRVPDTMTLTTDEPEIPSEYHHLLVTYALVKCFERENDYEAALYHQQRLDVGIQKCRGEVQYDVSDKTQPKTIGGPWDSPESTLTVWKQ